MAEASNEPIVWVVDRQQWPRACMRAELMERGFYTIGFVRIAHALAALQFGYYERPQVIVLELFDLGVGESQMATLAGFGIPTILLGGARQLNEEWVKRFEWSARVQRPFTIGQIADLVETLTGRTPHSGSSE